MCRESISGAVVGSSEPVTVQESLSGWLLVVGIDTAFADNGQCVL